MSKHLSKAQVITHTDDFFSFQVGSSILMASLTQTQHKWIGLIVTRLERVGTLLFMILRVTKTKKNKTIAPPKGLQRHGEEDDIPENADVEGHGQDQDQEVIPANNGLTMNPVIEYHPSPAGEQSTKDHYHEEIEGSYQKASEGPSNDELDDILERRMKFESEEAIQIPVDMDEFEMKKLNLQRMIPMIEHQCDEDFEADPDEIPKALDPKDVTDVQDDRRPKTNLTDLFPKTTSDLTRIE